MFTLIGLYQDCAISLFAIFKVSMGPQYCGTMETITPFKLRVSHCPKCEFKYLGVFFTRACTMGCEINVEDRAEPAGKALYLLLDVRSNMMTE